MAIIFCDGVSLASGQYSFTGEEKQLLLGMFASGSQDAALAKLQPPVALSLSVVTAWPALRRIISHRLHAEELQRRQALVEQVRQAREEVQAFQNEFEQQMDLEVESGAQRNFALLNVIKCH